ncbi:hypothetical protein AA21952_3146 [Acetobacter oeni LMG 21952]|nr:hypothetical protein AA21952_3146 [Acetobacter oeni LMG 21952]
MTCGVWRHIRENEIGFAAQHFYQASGQLGIGKITFDNLSSGHFIDWQEIDADYTGRATFNRNLGPAARSGAQVDHALPGSDQVKAIIEFDKFKGCTGTPALLMCGLYIGIVKLTSKPALLSRGSSP